MKAFSRFRRDRLLLPLAPLPVLFAALPLMATAATPDAPPFIHIRNFARVDDHVYRGAQPTPAGLRELADAHVGMVVDLREPGPAVTAEKSLVESLGMKYAAIQFPSLSAPSAQQLRRALALLESNQKQPVFVHCWRGKDRTGTLVACYRIEHDRWSPRQALTEARHHGMSNFQRSMRAFILQFQPGEGALPPLLPTPLSPNP